MQHSRGLGALGLEVCLFLGYGFIILLETELKLISEELKILLSYQPSYLVFYS